MTFVTFDITAGNINCRRDVISTFHSVAIRLTDDFTGKDARGHIKVRIKEAGKEAIKNLSGYYVFSNLPAGIYTVNTGSDLYFSEETVINTSKIKTSDLILEFDSEKPAPGTNCIILKDVSKLQNGDILEFHNPTGVVERKSIINVDPVTRTISWAGGLTEDFSALESTVFALMNPVVSILLKPLPSYLFPNHSTLVRGLITDSNQNPVVSARVEVENKDKHTKSDKNGEFVLYFSNAKNEKISIMIEKDGDIKYINTYLEEGVTKSLSKIVLN